MSSIPAIKVEIDELDEEVAMISKKSPKTLYSKDEIRQKLMRETF